MPNYNPGGQIGTSQSGLGGLNDSRAGNTRGSTREGFAPGGMPNPNTGMPMTPEEEALSIFQQAGNLQSTAATAGADAEIAGIREMIARLTGMTGGSFNPEGTNSFTDAGMQGLEGVQQGSTAGGFGARLDQIIGGDAFGGLVDERMRGAQGMLSAGGLTRSGESMEAGAAIPTELAMQLENRLFGRQAGLASQGFNAMEATAGRNFTGNQNFGSREDGLNAKIAQLLGGIGGVNAEGIRGSAEAEAGGILGEAGFNMQREQQKDQNKNDSLGLIGSGLGYAFGGPIGGAIGGGIAGLL